MRAARALAALLFGAALVPAATAAPAAPAALARRAGAEVATASLHEKDAHEADGPFTVATRGGVGEWNYLRTPRRASLASDEHEETFVQARDVRVGDLVHVGGGAFEPVLAILPQSKPCATCLIKVTTEDGKVVTLSVAHLVPIESGQLPSTRLEVGSMVKVDNAGNLSYVAVASISRANGVSEVRMPLTPSCRLDVNGVIVSCASTGTAPPNLLAALLVPVRVLHAVVPLIWYTSVHDQLIVAFAGPVHFLAAVSVCALLFRFAEVSHVLKVLFYALFDASAW